MFAFLVVVSIVMFLGIVSLFFVGATFLIEGIMDKDKNRAIKGVLFILSFIILLSIFFNVFYHLVIKTETDEPSPEISENQVVIDNKTYNIIVENGNVILQESEEY